MPLARCRECQNEISTEAVNCPHCGAPFPAKKKWAGRGFEWRSKQTFYGYPLIHVAFGRDAQNKIRVAKGVIAVGQFGIGLVTFAQFGIGLLFGFGQFMLGLTGIAQFAVAGLFGIGQFATGYVAIGQFALGYYALAQVGFGKFIWSQAVKDPEAMEFFRQLLDSVRDFLRI
ncbi:MAG: zinc ribbon domain-containing protein [candidate division WOR-3 bacterium]|nr:MAG: zinc ribbon domain-containing protein [candidate division WOR-3 bacterium]